MEDKSLAKEKEVSIFCLGLEVFQEKKCMSLSTPTKLISLDI